MEKKICIDCKEEKFISEFSPSSSRGKQTYRAECRVCSKIRSKNKKENNPYTTILNYLAEGILKRTTYKNYDANIKNKVYVDNNVKCLLGNSRGKVVKELDLHFGNDIKTLLKQNKKPSVDRINSSGNYEIGNIRIMELSQNVALGVDKAKEINSNPIRVHYLDGTYKDFNSITDTSKEIGCKRDTIYAHPDGTKTRKGLTFEIIR